MNLVIFQVAKAVGGNFKACIGRLVGVPAILVILTQLVCLASEIAMESRIETLGSPLLNYSAAYSN